MSRNDSYLYSGAPANARSVAEKRSQQRTERDQVQRQLAPHEERIHETFENERKRMQAKLLEIVSPDTPDDNLKASLLAIRMTLESMRNLEQQINIILRPSRSREKTVQGESFDE